MRTTEVAVVGAGVIGAACAHRLANAGVRVTIIERSTPGSGASGASAGGVRQQNRDPRELALARYSVRLWTSLEAELSADVGYRRSGHITLAETEQEVVAATAMVARDRAAGLDIELLDTAVLPDVAPGLGPSIRAGAYCATDGYADPQRTTSAFVAAARRSGARILTRTRVTSLARRAGRVVGLETSRGKIACDLVVNAAGAWAGRLAAMAGSELCIEGVALEMARTAPAPRALGPVLASLHRPLSLKQGADRTFLIGGGRVGRARTGTFKALPVKAHALLAYADAAAVLPAVRGVRIATTWAGLEALTPDAVPFIGILPGIEGMMVVAGFSGHGFALAPGVAAVVERLVAGAIPPVDVSALGFRAAVMSGAHESRS
ncbi:MAG: NAD(P)/FAD-dependent oxidoreductase [Candidatus Limnocylindria bacterium]